MVPKILSIPEVAELFARAAIALHVNAILDSIEELPERFGYRIRSHDDFGPVPDIVVEYADDVDLVLDRVSLALEHLYG